MAVPAVWNGVDPVATVPENLAEGAITLPATVTCLPLSLDIPAGLKKSVVASSAAAAPPAKEFPNPLLCSIKANADAEAFPDAANIALTTETPIKDLVIFFTFHFPQVIEQAAPFLKLPYQNHPVK
jgi:hypothetical protein